MQHHTTPHFFHNPSSRLPSGSSETNSNIASPEAEPPCDLDMASLHLKAKQMIAQTSHFILGQSSLIDVVFATLFARGHVLLQDLPGTGKTSLCKILAQCWSCDFSRVQFTPDLMPLDITGASFYHAQEHRFEFKKGPLFSHVFLADEINRASPRTQSALLEAMEEGQVTFDRESHFLPSPFFVIATANPSFMKGTFPLPEAQLDRFMVELQMNPLSIEDETQLLLLKNSPHRPSFDACSLNDLILIQQMVQSVEVSFSVARYIASLIHCTRQHSDLVFGLSTRASLSLMRLSKSFAFLDGRLHVLPCDVQKSFPFIAQHRLCLKNSTIKPQKIIQQLLTQVSVHDS